MSLIKKSNELVIPTTVKMMIYGQAGMGKSTVALSAPKPLLLDSDKPFSKDESGNYYINITFDEVVTGDKYAVAYRNNTKGWNANFVTTNFDADTQTYRIPIPSSHLKDGENYTVQIIKKAGYNVNLGTVTLNFDDVQ